MVAFQKVLYQMASFLIGTIIDTTVKLSFIRDCPES